MTSRKQSQAHARQLAQFLIAATERAEDPERAPHGWRILPIEERLRRVESMIAPRRKAA